MKLEERISRLEKQNRHMKISLILALAVTSCVIFLGMNKPKQKDSLIADKVYANEFILRGNDITPAGVWATNTSGSPYLTFFGGGDNLKKETIVIKSHDSNGGQPSGGEILINDKSGASIGRIRGDNNAADVFQVKIGNRWTAH